MKKISIKCLQETLKTMQDLFKSNNNFVFEIGEVDLYEDGVLYLKLTMEGSLEVSHLVECCLIRLVGSRGSGGTNLGGASKTWSSTYCWKKSKFVS